MGRPKGSKNKPKAGAHDAHDAAANGNGAGPGPGHNKPELTDEQRRVLLLIGLSNIEGLQAEAATITSNIRLERKRLKADGFAKEEIDYALYLRKTTDTEALEKRQQEANVARWLMHPVGHQADIFGDGKDRTPGVEAAYEAGKNVGILNGEAKCPDRWSAESEQGQRWLQGWHDGRALAESPGIKELQERHNSESQAIEEMEQAGEGEAFPGADESGAAGYELRN